MIVVIKEVWEDLQKIRNLEMRQFNIMKIGN